MNIYMIGVCGVAMGSLAAMLKAAGHKVSGSDSDIYPPMSEKLSEWGVKTFNGYNPGNIGSPDLVIIGNAVSRGNPEVEHVLNTRLPYLSMAQAMYNFFLSEKEIISVSGTHGKTTTTALLYHILKTAGEDPSCFIGGVSNNLNSNFYIGQGRYFIIEGDEYDSAFFEKIPKFILYRPHHLVLTSLEFDHADIYKNIDEIKLWFSRLVNIIPSNGNIIFSNQYPHLKDAVKQSGLRTFDYGNTGSGFIYTFINYSGSYTHFTISGPGYDELKLKTKLFGDYNLANITAASAMSLELGVSKENIKSAVESFKGVRRRQELIFEKGNLKIYEDFAHHPTAIKYFLSELKKRFPDSAVCAVYEPRSATSRRNVFQKELADAFSAADRILIKKPYKLDTIPPEERIDIERVVKSINDTGKNALLFDNVDSIIDYALTGTGHGNNIIAVMSNGSFDGIYHKLKARAKEYHNETGD